MSWPGLSKALRHGLVAGSTVPESAARSIAESAGTALQESRAQASGALVGYMDALGAGFPHSVARETPCGRYLG